MSISDPYVRPSDAPAPIIPAEKRESILKLIRNLRARSLPTNGVTEAEAATAMAKLQDLLQRYQIELAELDFATDRGGVYIRTWIEFDESHKYWLGPLIRAITRYNLCDVIAHSDERAWGGHPARFAVVGEQHNTEMVVFIYEYLRATIDQLAEVNYMVAHALRQVTPRQKTKWMEEFRIGAGLSVQKTLYEQHVRTQQDTGTGASLVIMRDKGKELKDAFDKLYPPDSLTFSKSRARKFTTGGYDTGKARGSEVSIRGGTESRSGGGSSFGGYLR